MFDDGVGWGLSLIVFLPVIGAGAVLAIPKANEQLQKVTALLFATASFVAGSHIKNHTGNIAFYAIGWLEGITVSFTTGTIGICTIMSSRRYG